MNSSDKSLLIEERIDLLYKRLLQCDLCPRNCKVNRLRGEKGYCAMAEDLVVYTAFLHSGEEPGISGGRGSGTIFFSGCNLKCAYCQNYKFSHNLQGRTISIEGLAKIMLNLQKEGAQNINLVTPTHFLPQILKSIALGLKQGLKMPIVYNTSGYEKKEIIAQLEDIVDIYLTDMRYISAALAQKYSNASNYPLFCQEAILEMYRQVKEPIWDKEKLKKGLIVRQLVLPGHLKESKAIISWISENLPRALASIMFQYQPYFKANLYPEINHPLNHAEYAQIREFIEELGLEGWLQDFRPQETLAGSYFTPEDLAKYL
jgi:putative pyruvate formate lyase activating enzyme